MSARRQVCYRINRGECLTGYQDTTCGVDAVYTAAIGGTLLSGVVVTACGDCPTEVVVVAERDTITHKVQAEDCNGALSTLDVTNTVQTVPHPDAIQRVVICSAGNEYDRETDVVCDPATGARVWVVTHWPTNAPPGTAPTVEAYTLSGSAYAGSINKLVKCGATDYETTTQQVCVGGAGYTRTTFFDAQTLLDVDTVWQDTTGAVVPAPAGPAVLGACAEVSPIKVAFMTLDLSQPYSGEGPAPVQAITGADLQTRLGGATLLSITVKQLRGEGLLSGAVTLSPQARLTAGEDLSWSSHGADQEDGLDTAFSINAGFGGRTTLTVLYRA